MWSLALDSRIEHPILNFFGRNDLAARIECVRSQQKDRLYLTGLAYEITILPGLIRECSSLVKLYLQDHHIEEVRNADGHISKDIK